MKIPSFDFDPDIAQLRVSVKDVLERTIQLGENLEPDQLIGPYSPKLNPFLWEITHSLWFLENWTLREVFDERAFFKGKDEIYNSPQIRHGKRWASNLKPFGEVRQFANDLKNRLLERLESKKNNGSFLYLLTYAIYHADMHTEALCYQRQTRGLPPPSFNQPVESNFSNETVSRTDLEIPGGQFHLGALKSNDFAFDNEKWAHSVELDPFEISRYPVTQGEFREFVEDGGYKRSTHWSRKGKEWLASANRVSPLYWQLTDGTWKHRLFDEWEPIQENHPMIFVNYYEAQAYCNWADRRLPTEAEWELAASGWSQGSPETKRTYPWGNSDPGRELANLDWQYGGTCPVHLFPDSESPFGCRQMIGNCWEWTQSTFEAFPGFERDFYRQYSEPWFGSRKVLRGGSWMTRSRLIRNGFRNFFTPNRDDIPAGFRTCSTD